LSSGSSFPKNRLSGSDQIRAAGKISFSASAAGPPAVFCAVRLDCGAIPWYDFFIVLAVSEQEAD
jgi:hypothetical protein